MYRILNPVYWLQGSYSFVAKAKTQNREQGVVIDNVDSRLSYAYKIIDLAEKKQQETAKDIGVYLEYIDELKISLDDCRRQLPKI